MEEEEEKEVLARLVEEFPAALQDGETLPASPLSRRHVSREELQGESLEVGRRLLTGRGASAGLGALLCQAAWTRLLQGDLSPFHCPQEEPDAPEQEEEGAEPVVLFQSEAVQRLFLNKLLEVARAWHQTPPPPPPASPSSPHRCSVYAIKNTRRKMEDKHVVLPEFNQLFGMQDGVERAYYAVFDGHGGVDAATYAAAHLHVALSQQETLQSDATAAFKAAFRRTDEMFRGKARRERVRSGSTGVAVLLQGSELTVSWLGDSQALLVRKGEVVTLMEPHKPEREDEKQRIEDLGGCITFMGCWRVNGTYAVSRAIGDFDQKPYVSGEADSSSLRLHGNEDYLLLACDGFFDAVKPSEVPQLVLDALRGSGDPDEGGGGGGGGEEEKEEKKEEAPGASVAQRLVFHAKASGSSDNITVMVVFLQPPELLLSQDSTSHDAPQQE